MSTNRPTFLDSIHTGTQLRRTTPNNQHRRHNTTRVTRPMTLREQMQLALARRGRGRTRRGIGRGRGNRRRKRFDENTSIWYYVSKTGTTQGPITIKQMKRIHKKDINNSTYFWNGTTVPQWTQLSNIKDLQEQLTVSSTDCEYIWCCIECDMETNPQICDNLTWSRDDNGDRIKCFGATIWKLRCLLCKKIADKDDICPKCYSHLQPESALKKAQEKEDRRQSNIFLQGCYNMNSNRDNMRLLVSGLVNELQDKKLYNNFPIEINECVVFFCFNTKCMEDASDSWKSGANQLRWRESNTVVELLNKVDDNKKAVMIEGTHIIAGSNASNDYKTIRRVWKIQILNHIPKTMIDFSVGIAKKNGWKDWDPKHIVKIKGLNIGDVICMLYLISSDEVGGTLSFAVNGVMKDISITEIRSKDYRLVVVMRNPMRIKLIQ